MTRLVGFGSPKPPMLVPQPSGQGGDKLTNYLERLAKYVPVEIIAAFLAIRGYVDSQGGGAPLAVTSPVPAPSVVSPAAAPLVASPGMMPEELEIALFAGLVVLTPLYLSKVGGDVPRKALQIAIATLSFVVWTYAIGGPFFWGAVEKLTGTQIVYPAFAGAFAVIWSLAVGLVHPDP
jgi:hypothetical protein